MIRARFATDADRETVETFAWALNDDHVERGERPVLRELFAAIEFAYLRKLPIVVAEDDQGALGGMVLWLPLSAEPGEVTCLGTYVVPAWRGERVSSVMREFAEREWVKRGAKSFVGSVVMGNEAGLRSALAAGFVQTGWIVRKDVSHGEEGLRDEEGRGLRPRRRQGCGTEELLSAGAGI